jgi:hypothetical protein
MSIVTLPTFTPPDRPSVTETSDVEFERRWTAWKARGLAHERTVRRRFFIVAIAMGIAIGIGTLVAYGLRSL